MKTHQNFLQSFISSHRAEDVACFLAALKFNYLVFVLRQRMNYDAGSVREILKNLPVEFFSKVEIEKIRRMVLAKKFGFEVSSTEEVYFCSTRMELVKKKYQNLPVFESFIRIVN